MESQHDSLAQVPINSVLIGIFTETIKTMSEPGSKFPEHLIIQGGPATNTTARTYKFKTLDVLKYLDNLRSIIDKVIDDFVPSEDELFANLPIPSGIRFPRNSDRNINGNKLSNEPSETGDEKEEIKSSSEKDDGVAILDEPASSSELGETQEPIKPNTNQVKAMNGGGARKLKSRRLKYSFKNRK